MADQSTICVMKLDQLSDQARIWMFGAPAPLPAERRAAVLAEATRFLSSWSAHGAALRAAADVVDDSLLIIALDEKTDASGCSVDALFRFAGQLGMLDGGRVFYRTAQGVRSATRDEFRKLVDQGSIGEDTIVLDTTVERLGEIRSGAWQKRFADSWHGRAFGKPSPRT
jgi:hypothetical protein